jgi:hypothetical protein
MAKELCPVGTMYPDINLSNHLAAVQYANYGPAESRDSNPDFWELKQEVWGGDGGQSWAKSKRDQIVRSRENN